MRYYRKKTLDALRKQNKSLKNTIKAFLKSAEGKEYKKRKARECARVYRDKNREKIRQYQKEYQKELALLPVLPLLRVLRGSVLRPPPAP